LVAVASEKLNLDIKKSFFEKWSNGISWIKKNIRIF
jgi:hypothetical protein